MHALIDLLPVAAFVGAYWLWDFRVAVAVIMAAMLLQVAVTWLIKRSVSRMLLVSTALVVVLGGVGLVLDNDFIFKWKPTVLNWAFALVCYGSEFIGGKPVIQRLLESVSTEPIRLSPPDWRTLNRMWAAFFLVSGAANLFVAYSFPESVWVNFKLFGLMGMTLVFVLLQGWWLSRRVDASATGSGEGS
ncbi:MAG: septation protein IspZ [Gammaproteobacteria bacterium]|nr:septation protein IspZ [Gammaproteobacteria bacterium]